MVAICLPASGAAKKTCPKGYVLKTGKNGKKVCKKKQTGPKVAQVEKIIRGAEQASRPASLTADKVEVIFQRKTKVLSKVNGYVADRPAWPVRAWVKTITHRDDTPEDDTRYGGCNGHLDHAWPHDKLFYFFKTDSGKWDFRGSDAGTIGCG